jgi:branched-chain amino acid transport system permease protein
MVKMSNNKSAQNQKSALGWLFQIILSIFVIGCLYGIERNIFPLLDGYQQIILINAGIAVILAVSLNLINGITGQFSLGHAGFMAIGAYTCAYFTKEIGGGLLDPINLLLGLTLGAVCAGIAGFLVGMPSLRLRGDYLAIVTLGFNQIIVSIIRNMKVVGEASGYVGIPKLTSFAWVFGMVFLCILTIKNLACSGIGRSMRAVRDDEIAAEAAGINTTQIKVTAFVFSAMWAGVAGGLQANFIRYANPNDFTFMKSFEIVVSVVLGGLGSITGSALAAAGLKVLEEVLREVPGVFWTGLGLIALATYWGYIAHRAEIKRGFSGIVSWLLTPTISLILVLSLYFYAFDWLNESKGSLRYILYAIILIVLMLLRPQGLLGRNEWSFSIKKLFNKIKVVV